MQGLEEALDEDGVFSVEGVKKGSGDENISPSTDFAVGVGISKRFPFRLK